MSVTKTSATLMGSLIVGLAALSGCSSAGNGAGAVGQDTQDWSSSKTAEIDAMTKEIDDAIAGGDMTPERKEGDPPCTMGETSRDKHVKGGVIRKLEARLSDGAGGTQTTTVYYDAQGKPRFMDVDLFAPPNDKSEYRAYYDADGGRLHARWREGTAASGDDELTTAFEELDPGDLVSGEEVLEKSAQDYFESDLICFDP